MTLEERLETFEQSGLEIYQRLHAAWKSNQDRCTDLLRGVEIHYPFFSLHDASHLEKVISNIERLLGERVEKLSATDTWLILHATYMHDLGMIIPDKEYRNVWYDSAFQEYLKKQQDSPMADIREASNFLRNLPADMANEKDLPQNWPVEVYFSSSLLISDYFRRNHAERIHPYLEDGEQNNGISFANINNKRVVRLLGKIASLHTNEFSEVMKLERTSLGLGGSEDNAHPRFVAELLRLGDALDLDAGRFPYDLKYFRGDLPESSDVHRRFHFAVQKFNISPAEVIYSADCEDYETYNQIKQLTGYMAEEFKNFAYNWEEIVPDDFPLPRPRFNFSEQDILYKGKPDKDNRAGLRFTLMESKAFQLLEGANIYDSKMELVRELLQNALDASKIQLWHDLQHRHDYKKRLPKNIAPGDLQPYHIPPEIFKNYDIEITVTSISEEKAELKFTDYGTGFSMDSIRQMCQVAKSYSARTAELEQMPPWLRPTGGFGIGLQSAFLMASKITIDTSAEEDGSNHYLLEIDAPRNGGRVRLSELPPREDGRGSAVSIEISGEPTTSIDPASFQKTTRPFSRRFYWDVAHFCRNDCGRMLFPARVVWGDDTNVSYNTGEEDFSFLASEESKDSEQYRYRFKANGAQIVLWDKKDSIMIHAGFKPEFELDDVVCFKGMTISQSNSYTRLVSRMPFLQDLSSVEFRDLLSGWTGERLSFQMDVHGMSADGTLELNRSSFTKKGRDDVRSKLAKAMDFYMKVLTDEIKSVLVRNDKKSSLLIGENQTPDEEPFNCRLAYWCSTTPEMRQEIARKSWWLAQSKPIDLNEDWDDDDETFHCLQLLDHGCETRRMSVQEYAQSYMSLPYMQGSYNSDLNQQYEQFLRSFGFNQILLSHFSRLPEIAEHVRNVYAFSYKDEDGDYGYESIAVPDENPRSEGFHTDEKTTELMFQQTFESIDDDDDNDDDTSWSMLPPLEEYQPLWVDRTDVEIRLNEDWPFDLSPKQIIIFPLPGGKSDSNILEAITQSLLQFLDALAASERFLSLVRFVTEKATHPTNTDTVKAAYLRLAKEIWKAVNDEGEKKHE